MKIFGLIGFPLGQSLSKILFTKKITEEAINDCLFELYPLDDISLFETLLKDHNDIAGLAVTIPYKELVIPYLTWIDEAVKEIKAVNCIVINGSEIKGYNTDVIGFEKSFTPLVKSHHHKALVLGTGGASKAVQFVLNKIGMPFLTVSRKSSKQKGDIFYDDINEGLLNEFTVVINCTPIGMFPDIDDCPEIPFEYIGEKHLLYDLIYKPVETKFLQKGQSAGASTKNGYEMFLIQAEENWKLWNAK